MDQDFESIENEAFGDEEGESRPRRPKLDILYVDEDFFAIGKPAGVFFEGGLFDDPSVVESLSAEFGDESEKLAPIYSVDPDVSGVLIVARREAVRDALIDQFDAGTMTVTFLALVRGMVMSESGTLDRPVTLPKSGRVKVAPEHGQPARTDWRVRDSFVGFALLECQPRTRLEQQVRAQLHDAGLPLAVDTLHGGASKLMLSSFKAGYRRSRRRPERPLIERASLHAATVEFKHPTTGDRMRFEAAMPKDLKATLHQLNRFGRIAK